MGDSSRCARDVEPLVDGWVDWCGSFVLVLGDFERRSLNAVLAVGYGGVGAVKGSVIAQATHLCRAVKLTCSPHPAESCQ
jgi:hypothetical protein